jgi:guanine deaminase
MREAIDLSVRTMRRGGGGPFGAVVIRGSEVIARGWNQVTSSNDPTAHAEIVAIRRACRRLKTFHLGQCDLYTSCEPCPMCLSAIYWAHVRRVYYGATRRDAAAIDFDDHFIYQEIGRPVGRRRVRMKQLMRTEALVAFDEWKRKEDKIPY